MSSRGRIIYGEITSFKSTHATYTLIHVPFIDVDFFSYLNLKAKLCNDALIKYVKDMIFTVGIHKFIQKTTEFQLNLMFPSGNIELRRDARGTPSALSSSESYV